MSEIPADILETATAIVDRIAKQHFLKGDCVADVAQAILSERQRHAVVMEEVRKVLEPFAEEAAVYDPDTGDGDDAVWATPAYFRIKHLRGARALLSRLEER